MHAPHGCTRACSVGNHAFAGQQLSIFRRHQDHNFFLTFFTCALPIGPLS